MKTEDLCHLFVLLADEDLCYIGYRQDPIWDQEESTTPNSALSSRRLAKRESLEAEF